MKLGVIAVSEPAIEALGRAQSEATRRLTTIATSDWEHATPCPAWNVRQLVNHVVGLQHRIARLLRGGTREEYIATREDDWIGADHIAAWQAGVGALDEAIGNTRSLEIPVDYRIPMTARELVGLAAFDTAIHSWDVSRAIGFDEQLDDGLVEFALGFVVWLCSESRYPGYFPIPKDQLPQVSSPQDHLLHRAGRHPDDTVRR